MFPVVYSATQPRRFWSAAIFWQNPGTCLFLLFYNHNMMLVKLDCIAPSFTGEVLNGVTMYKRTSFLERERKKERSSKRFTFIQVIAFYYCVSNWFVRCFCLRTTGCSILTKKANVGKWSERVGLAWLVYLKCCECTNQVNVQNYFKCFKCCGEFFFFFNSLPPSVKWPSLWNQSTATV